MAWIKLKQIETRTQEGGFIYLNMDHARRIIPIVRDENVPASRIVVSHGPQNDTSVQVEQTPEEILTLISEANRLQHN